MELMVILVSFAHLFFTPYTKVEESFNIQAVHDVLYHRWNISNYDHLEFPGVVPRTFIGPLLIAFLSAPFVFIAEQLNLGSIFLAQFIVRAVLCLCVTISLLRFQRALRRQLGNGWSWWYLTVMASQYHVLYYSSRPLPNILAIPFVFLALSAAFTPKQNHWFLILSGAAIIWFRTELALLFGSVLVVQMLGGKINFKEVLKVAVPAGVILVILTFVVDSFFWQRPVWPEAEVFYFNAILNKSSQWGTSPFLWYFYSALPRGLGASIFLVPIGLFYEARIRRLVFVALLFVFIFSLLPHKELRFIIYTFPLLNAAVAAACHRLWENRNKSPLQWLLGVGVAGHLVLNAVLTIFLLMVARVNYPGGEAMTRLHQLLPPEQPVYVHIGNLAAQTGVTRFTQINPNWRYDKKENLRAGSAEMLQYTHLLVEAKSKYSPNLKPYAKSHTILDSIDGFSEIVVNNQLFLPVRIKTKPFIFILQRNPDVIVPELTKDADNSEENVGDSKEIEEEESIDATEEIEVEKEQEIPETSLEIDDEVPPIDNEAIQGGEENILTVEEKSVEEVFDAEEELVEEENLKEESDDLLAMETVDMESLILNIEERLSSKESSKEIETSDDNKRFDNILQDNEIMNDIIKLARLDPSRPIDLEQMKLALKSILFDLKNKSNENDAAENSLKENNDQG